MLALLFPCPVLVLTKKRINVVGDSWEGALALQPQPVPKSVPPARPPFGMVIGCMGIFSHFPKEQCHQRVTLLSRPSKPTKSSLAGVSRLRRSSLTRDMPLVLKDLPVQSALCGDLPWAPAHSPVSGRSHGNSCRRHHPKDNPQLALLLHGHLHSLAVSSPSTP